ncbi:MAG TPA: DNA polymerase III subunit delta [Acidobacteriaceae bacterium]|jgi:DNA polymerase-3 subunit delta|nr:DNA polymerase III subunit delta [Acidobacteriaceae bacterium]
MTTQLGGSFAAVRRFLAEIGSDQRRAGYVLLGDAAFFQQQCRQGILDALVDPSLRDFCVSEVVLGELSVFDAIDSARTPSLMAPFQVIFVRNVKTLYQRGSKKEEFAAIEAYFRDPNPQAMMVYVADTIHLPADVRRMDMQDKEQYEKIRETLGEHCGMVELAEASEADAMRWVTETTEKAGVTCETDAARELVDALHGEMMSIAAEVEKLLLYVTGRKSITLEDVETMVDTARQRSLYELTDAISLHDKTRALLLLQGFLNASDGGDEAAIGHIYMMSRTLRQMLVVLEKNVRDSRAIWQALWPGFRVAPFAVDDLIRQARRYKNRKDLMRMIERVAQADREVRSSPVDKRLVLEQLVIDLANEGVVNAYVGSR